MEYFFNDGFGWFCISCFRESSTDGDNPVPRIYREGEAEEGTFTERGMARWTDASRRYLTCPICGITALVDKC